MWFWTFSMVCSNLNPINQKKEYDLASFFSKFNFDFSLVNYGAPPAAPCITMAHNLHNNCGQPCEALRTIANHCELWSKWDQNEIKILGMGSAFSRVIGWFSHICVLSSRGVFSPLSVTSGLENRRLKNIRSHTNMKFGEGSRSHPRQLLGKRNYDH